MDDMPDHDEIAAIRDAQLAKTGTADWIAAQHRLAELRAAKAHALLGSDPYEAPQAYFDALWLAERTESALVIGCIALARRHGIADAVNQIRAADLDPIQEHLLLDAFTRSAY